ncbi:rod shape-determining protein MreD [Levilactobacillus bambusae]|uniref:Rod shape-determining protein MreD n=2 Tax=Levilactobacillus bambusae TaxID=2024736 RepID=A0A2V1MZI3_9LACO|nr:rod shape-determining protein MreD [Levilactobacillus bambusae]
MVWIFPVGLLLAFFLDGSVSQIFSQQLLQYPYNLISHLVVLWLVLATLFEDNRNLHLVVWAAIIGGIFDLYYTSIFGVYVFIFPLVVFTTRALNNYLQPNFLSGLLIYFIDITLVESLGYVAANAVHLTSTSGTDFLVFTLGPTLALNLALYVILYFPIRWLFYKYD